MKNITIKWQRLVDETGQTCPRCSAAEDEVRKAARRLALALMPRQIAVSLEDEVIDPAAFAADPSVSNRIWVGNRPLEDWVGANVGQSPCCGSCGDAECRTVEVDGEVYETIPADMIVLAGMMAAYNLEGPGPSLSCCAAGPSASKGDEDPDHQTGKCR